MNHWTFRRTLILVAALFVALAAGSANAANLPITGSYEVVTKTNAGSQAKVVLRIHLTNHSQAPLYLDAIVLRDLAQAASATPGHLAVMLSSGNTEQVTQEFVIPRREFDQWRRGTLPRFVLNLKTVHGTRIRQAIRLDHMPARKGE